MDHFRGIDRLCSRTHSAGDGEEQYIPVRFCGSQSPSWLLPCGWFNKYKYKYNYCFCNQRSVVQKIKKITSKTLMILMILRLMERFKSVRKCKSFSWWNSKLISNIQQPNMCYTLTQRSQWLHVKILPMCVSTRTLSGQLSSPLSSLFSSSSLFSLVFSLAQWRFLRGK